MVQVYRTFSTTSLQFYNMSLGWFDYNEPSLSTYLQFINMSSGCFELFLSTPLQGNEGVQGADELF